MNHDIDIKKVRINCFRQSKVPGEFMLQMRVPGGVLPAEIVSYALEIAKRWGNGDFHIGTRQTLDFPGIKYEDIPAVNEFCRSILKRWISSSAARRWRPARMGTQPSAPAT